MIGKKLMTTGLAAVAALSFAGSAHAAIVDTDSVKLTSTGYDFGGSAWLLNAPTGSGEIHFHYENGTIRPHLLGTLHLNDADGTCARIRLTYYDGNFQELAQRDGGSVCVYDDAHHAFSVDLDPYSDPAIHSVNVSVLKETATGLYRVAQDAYSPSTTVEDIKITEPGVDFGGSSYLVNAPTGSGSLFWHLGNGHTSPQLTGTLHLDNSSGACARMNLRYLTEGGTFLHSEAGGQVCSPDNGHHSWSVDLQPYTASDVGKVDVQLQTLAANGSWIVAGSQTVSVAE